jgi:hypothetical protein
VRYVMMITEVRGQIIAGKCSPCPLTESTSLLRRREDRQVARRGHEVLHLGGLLGSRTRGDGA